MAEVLRKAGFRNIEPSAEGESTIGADQVPHFESREELLHSLFVDALIGIPHGGRTGSAVLRAVSGSLESLLLTRLL